MQRFNIGDPVLILPKFAHLYPGTSGTVVNTKSDPFRPMFNEYTVSFDDGSTADLFEFQILEDGLNYKTLMAVLTFDSQQNFATSQMPGEDSGRQIILQTSAVDINMTIQLNKFRAAIIGHILEKSSTNLVNGADVRLLKESVPIHATISDNAGVFKFSGVSRGPLNILVVFPTTSLRIFASFSI